MIRECVILAAGEGKRMKQTLPNDELKNLPKPLVPVLGKPLIKYAIDQIIEKVDKIVIVINPQNEKIFKEKLNHKKIFFAYQEKPLGTAHALYCAKNFIKEELFLVAMGDDIYIDNFDEILKINRPTIFGFEVEDVSNFGAIISENGKFVRIAEKELKDKGIANTGLYIMHRKFFEIFEKIPMSSRGEYYLTEAPRILREVGIEFEVRKIKYWFPVNNYQELLEAERKLRELKLSF